MAKKTGRPKSANPKSTFISMKTTDEEADLIRQAAEREQRPVSAYCRIAVVEHAKRVLGIDPPSVK